MLLLILAVLSTSLITNILAFTVDVNAISPSCSTTTIAVSSSCIAGVHTLSTSKSPEKRGADPTTSEATVFANALTPTCITSYSTSVTCHAGVHPQPTFSATEITVTETTSTSGAGTSETITTTTLAQMSISAPPATATGSNYTFFITPKLQGDILDIANQFCGSGKEKRQAGGGCRLPQTARASFLSEVTNVVGQAVEGTTIAQTTAPAAALVLGIWAFNILLLGGSITTSFSVARHSIQSAQNSLKTTTTSTSTSSSAPAELITLFPGPPNDVLVTALSQEVIALTSFWKSYFDASMPDSKTSVTATPRLPCTHGADPQLHSGAAGYCQCTDGKIYPTSPKSETTTIDGTVTTYLNDCPYTTIPKSTTNLGAPITPTVANPKPTRLIGPVQCFSAPALRFEDMTSKVSSFCSTASQDGYSYTYRPGATKAPSDNLFSNGQAQRRYPVDSSRSDGNTSLEVMVKFLLDACEVGEQTSVDFKNFDWCTKKLLKIVNNCNTKKPPGTDFWKMGGTMLDSCVEWTIRPHDV